MSKSVFNMTTEQVDAALVANGYTDNQIAKASYLGTTISGKAQYEILYRGGDGHDLDRGVVYVEYVPGVGIIADF